MNWHQILFPPLLVLSGLGTIFLQTRGSVMFPKYDGPRYNTEVLEGSMLACWAFWLSNMITPLHVGTPTSIVAIATMISFQEHQWVITFSAMFIYAILNQQEINDSVLFGVNLMLTMVFLTIELGLNLFYQHPCAVVKIE